MVPMTLLRLGMFGTLAMAAVACSVQVSSGVASSEPPPYTGSLGGEDAGSDVAATVSPGSSDPSLEPMLARVEDGQKMNAAPGQGVGVFSEYDSGGHWIIWWTCDTNITSENCPFDVKLSSEKSAITNAVSQSFTASDTLLTPSTPGAGPTGSIEAKTVTTTGTQGVTFDTDPGAIITLSATVGGLYNGKFLFWVQSGQVNGGFTGTVTDPLLLVGAAP